jgi:hypothetical protein
MSSQFESWFLHFVAEHNSPLSGMGRGEKINTVFDWCLTGVVPAFPESMSVSSDNGRVCESIVLPFRPRRAFKEINLSVA